MRNKQDDSVDAYVKILRPEKKDSMIIGSNISCTSSKTMNTYNTDINTNIKPDIPKHPSNKNSLVSIRDAKDSI